MFLSLQYTKVREAWRILLLGQKRLFEHSLMLNEAQDNILDLYTIHNYDKMDVKAIGQGWLKKIILRLALIFRYAVIRMWYLFLLNVLTFKPPTYIVTFYHLKLCVPQLQKGENYSYLVNFRFNLLLFIFFYFNSKAAD